MKEDKRILRQSNFELLRLISMFYIILYHLLWFFVISNDNSVIYKALCIPLHVGVLCFVLISGYFHIRPSWTGLFKILFPLFLYYIPLTIFGIVVYNTPIKELFFLSYSPYWFVRVYLFLFLIAPVLNSFLENKKQRKYLLIVLAFISIYMGMMNEPTLHNGKNVVYFSFLYVLGDSIKKNEACFSKIKTITFVCYYLLLNALLVILYCKYSNTIIGTAIWKLSYIYCSPILIINAILLFLIISRMSIRSSWINYLSASVFSMYIIHHQYVILYKLIGPTIDYFKSKPLNSCEFILVLSFITIVIMGGCVLIDFIFNSFKRKMTLLLPSDKFI